MSVPDRRLPIRNCAHEPGQSTSEQGVLKFRHRVCDSVRITATPVAVGFGLHRALLTDTGCGSGETVELTWRGELTGWSGQEVVIGVCEPGQ